MKNKKKSRLISDKKWIIAIITIVIVSYAAISVANPMDYRGKRGNPPFPQNQKPDFHMQNAPKDPIFLLFQILDLTDAQEEKIIGYSTKSRKDIVQLKADIQVLQIDKRVALKNENYKKVKKLIDQISVKKASIEKSRINLKEDISKMLTAEQKEELKENMMDRKKPKLDKYHKKLDKR
ncbi:MAG: Spy/CpxP family protein refolding chaperone [Candidatus Cloacimonadota bacterium]|nr:Spy/CpxP family protein refolding chaperone [Candidatus Cloacimonadota bacterium]